MVAVEGLEEREELQRTEASRRVVVVGVEAFDVLPAAMELVLEGVLFLSSDRYLVGTHYSTRTWSSRVGEGRRGEELEDDRICLFYCLFRVVCLLRLSILV